MAWLTGWSYRNKLTLDSSKVDSDCSDFPFKVILDGDNFDFTKALSTGNDIRFTSSDGETLLKYEREVHQVDLDWDCETDPLGLISIVGTGTTAALSTDYAVGGSKSLKVAFGSNIHNGGIYGQYFWKPQNGTSVEFYARLDSLPSDDILVLCNQDNGYGVGFNLYREPGTSGETEVQYINTQDNLSQLSGFTMSEDTWYLFQIAFSTSTGITWAIKSADGNTTHATHTQSGATDFSGYAATPFTISANSVAQATVYFDDFTISNNAFPVAVYPVKVPTASSTSDTDVYMYYGKADATDGADPTNVWDSNFALVNHMTPSLLDSTSNDNDGTNSGTTAGIAGDGYYRTFDGTDDYIYVPDDNTLDLSSALTAEVYAKMNNIETAQALVVKDDTSDGNSAYCLDIYLDVLRFFGYESTTAKGITTGSGSPASNVAYLNYGKKDGDSWAVGRNGTADATKSESATLNNTSNPLSIGSRYYGGSRQRWFAGTMYEVRISSTVRSDAWIKATHASLADTLLTYGSREALAGTARVMVVWA